MEEGWVVMPYSAWLNIQCKWSYGRIGKPGTREIYKESKDKDEELGMMIHF